MSYAALKHTADIRLQVSAQSYPDLYKESLIAVMSLLHDSAGVTDLNVKRQIVISAPDSTTLLIDFLNEALSLAHIHKEVYFDLDQKVINHQNLDVRVIGASVNQFYHDVKAVTFHEADINKVNNDLWQVNLILDI